MKFLILLIIACISITSCHNFPLVEMTYPLTVYNNTADTVAFTLGYAYPNITLPETQADFTVIYPHSKAAFDSKSNWRDRINSLPGDTLLLFAIDANKYFTLGYEAIRNANYYMAFKKIAAGDLPANADGAISYP